MPFFDPVPIDPELDFIGAIGPGRANRLDDRAKLASAIETKAGAAPHAELGRFGEMLARRFAGRAGGREDNALPPGFLGAIGAAQIRRGTDPDAAGGLQTLLDAVGAFQRNKRLKEDRLVNPGGPTERALDAQNEKARKARLERLDTVSREIMDSDAPEYAPVADKAAADSLAGLIVANEAEEQREERLAEPKPAPFRRGSGTRNADLSDGKDGGGFVLAQRKIGGGGPRGGGSDPTTHGNRIRDRIREDRERREWLEQKTKDPVGAAKGYVAQIGDKQVRRAVGRMLEDAKKPARQSGRDNLVNLRKDGGRKRALSDYYGAVREAGGSRSDIKQIDDRQHYTARDGTEIMFREVSRDTGEQMRYILSGPARRRG